MEDGGKATEFRLNCQFPVVRERERERSAEICFLVSMATAGYYP